MVDRVQEDQSAAWQGRLSPTSQVDPVAVSKDRILFLLDIGYFHYTRQD